MNTNAITVTEIDKERWGEMKLVRAELLWKLLQQITWHMTVLPDRYMGNKWIADSQVASERCL